MTVSNLAGYIASTMVLLTFLTKDMRLLRILALLSNVAFVTYGLLVWLPPVFCLHLLLLPVNAIRLREILIAENSRPLLSGSNALDRSRSSRFGAMEAWPQRTTTDAWRSLRSLHSKSA